MFMVWPAYVSSGEVFPQRALSASLCDPGGGGLISPFFTPGVLCLCLKISFYSVMSLRSGTGGELLGVRRRRNEASLVPAWL